MKFKPGELVIKNTGGNKMIIVDYIDNYTVNCVWATENIHSGSFDEKDLLYINEYQSVITSEKRDDLINKIIN